MSIFSKLRDFAAISQSPSDLLSIEELVAQGYASDASRYGKVKRALAKGDLIRLRRGLYLRGEKFRRGPVDLFAIAQGIYGPSYISCESALAYWGLIPEQVYSVTCISSKRSREFKTEVGLFSYVYTVNAPLYWGTELVKNVGQSFVIAKPVKALLDYVMVHKVSVESALHWLENSLRIEGYSPFSTEDLISAKRHFKSKNVLRFINLMLEELADGRGDRARKI